MLTTWRRSTCRRTRIWWIWFSAGVTVQLPVRAHHSTTLTLAKVRLVTPFSRQAGFAPHSVWHEAAGAARSHALRASWPRRGWGSGTPRPLLIFALSKRCWALVTQRAPATTHVGAAQRASSPHTANNEQRVSQQRSHSPARVLGRTTAAAAAAMTSGFSTTTPAGWTTTFPPWAPPPSLSGCT